MDAISTKSDLDDVTRDALLDASEQGIGLLLTGLRDGHLTDEELEAALVGVVAASLDAVIPTGVFDPVDDAVIHGGVAGVYRVVADALERDPARMRARAARARARGQEDRAKRIEERAAKVAERRGS